MYFIFSSQCYTSPRDLHSFPTRTLFRSPVPVDGLVLRTIGNPGIHHTGGAQLLAHFCRNGPTTLHVLNPKISNFGIRSEEHTSELQSRPHLVCRLLLEKKKTIT